MANKGLVVEGGGTRGIYAAGALDVLGEKGFHFDGVMGVSAGAIHGCSFVAGQHGRSIRYYRRFLKDGRFFGWGNFLRTGNIVGNDFCYHEIPEVLDPFDFEGFKKSGINFYAVSSNIETGKAEYPLVKDMFTEVDLLRASGSMPYCSTVVEWNGMKLLDGGCTDSIPLEKMIELGYSKTIVVLTREEGYVKKPLSPLFSKLMYKKYPLFVQALIDRHLNYNSTLEKIHQLESEGKIIVIRPSAPLTISRLSRSLEELEYTYQLGRKDAEAVLSKVEQFLND